MAPGEEFGEHIQNWLQTDINDPGHSILSDEEIVNSVAAIDETVEVESDEDIVEVSSQKVTHAAGYNALTTALQWLKEQPEASSYNTGLLKSLKNVAASKRMDAYKQPSIQNFLLNPSFSCNSIFWKNRFFEEKFVLPVPRGSVNRESTVVNV